MSVRVDLNPILRRMYQPGYDPDKGLILTDAVGKTLHEIVTGLGIPPDEVSSILVNYRVEQPNYKVQDGDMIHLSVAISGG
jgi:Mut7-C ubiquitin